MSYRSTQNSLLKKHHDHCYLRADADLGLGVAGRRRGLGHAGQVDLALPAALHHGVVFDDLVEELLLGGVGAVVVGDRAEVLAQIGLTGLVGGHL